MATSNHVYATFREVSLSFFENDYKETKRIFGLWSNFGLAASMISVILGVIPLYTYSLAFGGELH